MENKKYFFFDIDGTLTNRVTGEFLETTIPMIKALQNNGYFVSLSTGRAHYKAIDTMKSLGIKHMVCNGGNGLVINESLVINKPLDREKAINLLKQIESLGYGALISYEDSKHVLAKNDLFLQQVGERKEPTEYHFDASLDYNQIENIFKIHTSIPKEKEYLLTLKDTLGHLRYVDEYMMFQEDNKRQGIIQMLDYFGGKLNEVVVFGDDYNDLDMFKEPFYSIAVMNACNELKEKANYVATTNLYEVCKYHGWIQ